MAGFEPQPWSTSLFGCFEDCGICLYGLLCLPCLFGHNAAKFHRIEFCTPCCTYLCCGACVCCVGQPFRADFRAKYNLAERPCSDFIVHCCFPYCAVCQEARELRRRGNPRTLI